MELKGLLERSEILAEEKDFVEGDDLEKCAVVDRKVLEARHSSVDQYF